MMLRSILAAAAAVILALPAAANAGPNASGQISIDHVNFTLTDLDPNDGITPSVTFADPDVPGLPPAKVFMFWFYDSTEKSAQGHEPLTYSIAFPGLSAGASVTGTLDPTTIGMSGHAAIEGLNSIYLFFWSAPLVYTLSPHTALTVNATVHFIGSSDGLQGDVDYELMARAEIAMSAPDGFFRLAFPSAIDVLGGPPVDKTVLLSGTDVNDGAGSLTGGLSLSGHIIALPNAVIAPSVPEPGQAALLGAGLPLLLRLFGLRRRSHFDRGNP